MERYFARLLSRFAPRLASTLRALSSAGDKDNTLVPRIIAYENEVRELRAEIDDLRRDSLRIAELYDVVFARLADQRNAARDGVSDR